MDNQFKELTVWQVNEYLRMLLDSDPLVSSISVRGEISNFKFYPSSGHMYFSLKDEEAILKGVMFKSNASALKFMPKDGMKVVAKGKISVYPRDGVYQLYVSSMKQEGKGDLFEALEKLKKKLSEKGLFSSEHKKPIPPYPRHVGIVTSEKGAALRDMLNVIKRRNPGVDVSVYPSAVQGEGAWRELSMGIEYFAHDGTVDLIIIGRGGGAYEDLWEFNNENLAMAIYNCPIPVISGVGHETDFTVCDFVADLRAPTPSAAAELAVPTVKDIRAALLTLENRAASRLEAVVSYKKGLLAIYESRCRLGGQHLVSDKIKDIENIKANISQRMGVILEMKKMALGGRINALQTLNPLSVLSRGFSYVENESTGRAVSSVNQVCPGDRLKITLGDGVVAAAVTHITADSSGGLRKEETVDGRE